MTLRLHERGAGAATAVVMIPAVLAMLLLVVFAGRVADLDQDVTAAARAGARAASLRNTAGGARAAAGGAVNASLGTSGISCASRAVSTNTGNFGAGGTVSVTVSCTVPMSGLTGFGFPGSRTVSHTAEEVIDQFTFRG